MSKEIDKSEVVEVALLQIDFNKIESMILPEMNNGTGMMSARMYNDDSYRIIPTSIHPGGNREPLILLKNIEI